MPRPRLLHLAAAVVLLAGCGEADTADGAAVAACRALLVEVGAATDQAATTVRQQGRGFVVEAWSSGRAEGSPDHRCEVARDPDAPRGVAVVRLQTRDSSGGGYSSRLDVELDR